jgi:DNA-binding transcriptional LysR family regulator
VPLLPGFRAAFPELKLELILTDWNVDLVAENIDGDVALSSALSLRSAVLDGAGPALLAEWLVRDDLAAGRLVELLGDYDVAATEYETAAWILYPSRAYLPLEVRAMVDFLKGRLAASRPSSA